jgi:biotin carboxyl carrier protein
MKYITTIGEKEFEVEVIDERRVMINNQIVQIDFHPISDQPVYSLLIDGKSYEAYVFPMENSWQVLLHGKQYAAQVEDERERRLRAASSESFTSGKEFHLKAPMPGLVITVAVEDGQKVQKGDLLAILESMKMQNELKSPRDGIVSRIRIVAGDSVEQRQTILSVI